MSQDQRPLFELPADDDLPPEYIAGIRSFLQFIRERKMRGWFSPKIKVSDGKVLDWQFSLEENGRPTKKSIDNLESED